ncbi:MAG: Ig domain-containing protein [Thermoanaerobaculia bacterium]
MKTIRDSARSSSSSLLAVVTAAAALASLFTSSTAMAQCPVIAISPASLANATAGQAYGPVAFSALPASAYTFDATGLPTGLTMSVGGSLSGTPTQAGSFAVRTVATSAASCLATHIIPLTVLCPTITVTPATMPDGLVGVAYPNQTMGASGGTVPYTFAVTSGSLPPGLTLTGGVVSGTPTTSAGSPFDFTITATDANGCTGSRAYTVTIGTCPTITVTNPAVVDGTNGSPIGNATFTQVGATTPSFTVATGTLPNGITLNPGTGVLGGTPTQTGTFNITVKATETTGANTGCNGTGGTYTFQICPTITVTNPAVVNGTNGSPYTTVAFTQTGATTPGFTIGSGTLPTGLNLNSGTGIIGGTPTQSGTFTVTVRATETAAGGTLGCFGTGASYTFQICPVITVSNPAVVNGVNGSAYTTAAFTQSGATTPSFTIASGTLPTGLGLNAGSGIISGTPTQTGTFTVTVKATETAAGGTLGCFGTGTSYTFKICPVITVTNPATNTGVVNVAGFSQTFTQTGATTPSFSTSSTLPTGISLSSAGILSGTPSQAGVFPITVTVTDTAVATSGCTGAGGTYTLTIRPQANAKTYAGLVGNTQAYVSGGTTVAPTTPTVTLTTGSINTVNTNPGGTTLTTGTFGTTNGGSVTIAADGTFLYTPPVSTVTNDTFSYTNTSNAVTNSGTITLTFAGRVWWVKNNALVGTNDGRSNTPRLTLPGAAIGGTGDVVYVFTGTGSTTGTLTMQASQLLWGNGVAFAISNIALASGTKPTLTGTITLANGVTVTGVTINPAGSTSAVTGSGVGGTVTIDQNTLSASNTGTTVNLSTGSANINFTATTIAQSGAGTGLAINGKTGGTVSFDATSPISVTGAGATGINLTGNGGATINFAGALTLTTTTGPAFIATGGGTVTATGSGSVISTTTAPAVNVANTTIGAANLTFQSVSAGTAASGPANGIILNVTGSAGGLKVTGTGGGAAGTGGTIQKATVDGISLTSTQHVSLAGMNVQNGTRNGILGSSVTDLDLSNCSISGNGTTSADVGIKVTNLAGSCTWTDVSVTASALANVFIDNTVGTLSSFTISGNSHFDSLGTAFGGNSILFNIHGTAVLTNGSITGATFVNNKPARGFTIQAQDTGQIGDAATNAFTVQNCTFTNNGLQASFEQAHSANLTFKFLNNGTAAIPMTMPNTGVGTSQAVNVASSSTTTGGTIRGRLVGNYIGNGAVAGSGSAIGNGLRVFIQGKTAATLFINGNVIRQTPQARGMDLQFVGQLTTGQPIVQHDLTLTGNDVIPSDTTGFPAAAIAVSADNQGSPARVRSNVTGNLVPATAVTGDYLNAHLILANVAAGAELQLVDSTSPISGTCASELAGTNTGTTGILVPCSLIAGPISTPP